MELSRERALRFWLGAKIYLSGSIFAVGNLSSISILLGASGFWRPRNRLKLWGPKSSMKEGALFWNPFFWFTLNALFKKDICVYVNVSVPIIVEFVLSESRKFGRLRFSGKGWNVLDNWGCGFRRCRSGWRSDHWYSRRRCWKTWGLERRRGLRGFLSRGGCLLSCFPSEPLSVRTQTDGAVVVLIIVVRVLLRSHRPLHGHHVVNVGVKVLLGCRGDLPVWLQPSPLGDGWPGLHHDCRSVLLWRRLTVGHRGSGR